MPAAPVPLSARPVHEARALVGESPLWDAREGLLWWTDIPRGELHGFDPATGRDALRAVFPGPLSAVALRASGGLLLALGDTLAGYRPERGGEPEPLARVRLPGPDQRLNDGRCDPEGRFWVGGMSTAGASGAAALHRLDGTSLTTELTGVSISNGLDWSPDGRLAYYADSPTREVAVYDRTGPALRRTGTLARVTDGVPDGLTVDAEGGVWVALFGGYAVHRYLPDGTLAAVVEVPAAKVTSCAFGGPALETLYLTTASRGLTGAELREQPLAGSLFACAPGVRGLPAHAFAG
ncbi:SMP-30/gluconolactonase/LRE family protein [Kitasatospora sp. NPDC001540]|uniref:SMP-30/gluconolactonase/LRE family protein n=1 Tax=Kitasatospora sp. NPDC001540 TaxID=3364014 RepID=UPI0036CC6563